MIETIKHLTGMCGESHINLLTIIFLILIFKLAYEKIYKVARDNK
jgi:hypothetical protein